MGKSTDVPAWNPEFNPKNPGKKPDMMEHICNPNIPTANQEGETGESARNFPGWYPGSVL